MKKYPTLTCACGFSGSPAQFHRRKCCKRCWYASRSLPLGPVLAPKRAKPRSLTRAERRKARLKRAWELAKRKAAGARARKSTNIDERRANRVHKRRCRACGRIRQARFMILSARSPDHRGGTCCDCSKTRNAHLPWVERQAIQRRVWAAAAAKRLANAAEAA